MEYTDRYKAFCKRMSIYRKLMDYDQAKMAVRVGMTTPEYSNREAGRSMVSGIDLRKFSDSGADIDKMLVDVDEKPCRYVISSEIETFGEESKKEYVRGVVSEHILYMCEKKIADLPDYLMLGNMRGNRASIDIIDELKMCSSEEIATVKKIVDAFVLKKTEPY